MASLPRACVSAVWTFGCCASKLPSLRQVKEGLYVSLSQSQPEGLKDDYCLSVGGRLYFLFSAKTVAGNTFIRIRHAVAALPVGSGGTPVIERGAAAVFGTREVYGTIFCRY